MHLPLKEYQEHTLETLTEYYQYPYNNRYIGHFVGWIELRETQ